MLKEHLQADFDIANIIGRSQQMKKLLGMISMIALSEATVLITGEHISDNQLPLNITEKYPDGVTPPIVTTPIMDGTHSLGDIEIEAILAALKASQGNKAEASRRLGITRKTLHNKLKNYGLKTK